MKIDSQTKISDIIKADSRSIEAIASLSRPLEKLRNPLLRKIMASRVRVHEAAKMGGVTTEDFFSILKPLGFTPEEKESEQEQTNLTYPDWLVNTAPEAISVLDVRKMMDEGTEPLKVILASFKNVPEGQVLRLVTTFVPTPLIRLLSEHKAKEHFVEPKGPELYFTYFLKAGKDSTLEQEESLDATSIEQADFSTALEHWKEKAIEHLDVRAMEMPLPMQTILEALATLKRGTALLVAHKRVPVYLLEELQDREFTVLIRENSPTDVELLIYHRS